MNPMTDLSASLGQTPAPERRARFDLKRAVLLSALVLIGACIVTVTSAIGVWLSHRTRDEFMFAVALVWLVALTVMLIIHDHPKPKAP